jgi:excisionase family DNA binding protein
MHAINSSGPPREAPEIMTIDQVAAYLQLHPQVVYRHVRAGTLPASRIGRTIRFKKTVLDAFLEKGAWEFAGRYLAFVGQVRENRSVTAAALPASEVPRSAEVEPVMKQFSIDVD